MIYFSRKSDNFQDFIKFWRFVGTKKYGKICIFSMKWTERESVWPENYNFSMNITERDGILLENVTFSSFS